MDIYYIFIYIIYGYMYINHHQHNGYIRAFHSTESVLQMSLNVVTIITTSMKGRHGTVVQGAGRQLLQAVHVPEGPADA